ncbi:DUF2066 domain-containing protein [Lacibacterium aquatile]|uniref:DUF2066 domain-containing protein n=1 Tax=Lacibacterium aquatile TaxID=1168082 RepID=UPI0036D36AF4
MALFLSVTAAKAADEAFSISGVPVDKTAASAAVARDGAIAEGQTVAWTRLVEKLALDPSAAPRLTGMPSREIAGLVEGFQVEREQASTVRYIAIMTYRFRPAAVRQVFRGAGMAFTEGQARPVVVLPLLIEANSTRKLWEADNDWKLTWSQRPLRAGLVPLVLPRGGAEDAAVVDAAAAEQASANSAQMLLTRYSAIDVVVAMAAFEPSGVVGTLKQGGATIATARVPLGPMDTREEGLYKLAAELTAGLEHKWKSERGTPATSGMVGGPTAFDARVPLSGLAEWQEIRRRLATIPQIRTVNVRAVAPREAIVGLELASSLEQAKSALAARQLAIEEAEDGWRLRFTGQVTAPAPVPAAPAPTTAPVPATNPPVTTP